MESLLTLAQHKILTAAINMLIWLQFSVKEKSLSLARLGRMLFGKKSKNPNNLKARAKNQAESAKGEVAASEGSPAAESKNRTAFHGFGERCSEGKTVVDEPTTFSVDEEKKSKGSSKEENQSTAETNNKKDDSSSVIE